MKQTIDCPAERAIYFLGGKWKIRILFTLYNNKKVRFNILKRGLKTITQQMLSKQLKELEIDGIVNRNNKIFDNLDYKPQNEIKNLKELLNII